MSGYKYRLIVIFQYLTIATKKYFPASLAVKHLQYTRTAVTANARPHIQLAYRTILLAILQVYGIAFGITARIDTQHAAKEVVQAIGRIGRLSPVTLSTVLALAKSAINPPIARWASSLLWPKMLSANCEMLRASALPSRLQPSPSRPPGQFRAAIHQPADRHPERSLDQVAFLPISRFLLQVTTQPIPSRTASIRARAGMNRAWPSASPEIDQLRSPGMISKRLASIPKNSRM